MKAIGFTSAAIVSLVFGIAAPAFAQQGQQGDQRDHSPQQNSRRAPVRPNRRRQRVQEQQRVRHGVWQEHRARSWESDHRTWQQRGGYQGYRVPDVRYRRYFGPQHGFRVNRLPFRVVSGQPRFQYRGYWVTVVDPWPENWSDNWYETDDVYVSNVDNGYYLFNRRHPQARIALRISM
jgi:hypothetical protein